MFIILLVTVISGCGKQEEADSKYIPLSELFRQQLIQNVRDFDSRYLYEQEKSELIEMLTGASGIWVVKRSSSVVPTVDGQYRVLLNSSIFSNKLALKDVLADLKSNPNNLVLVLTLYHELRHFHDLRKPYLKAVYTDHVDNSQYGTDSLLSGTLAEYFAYKDEYSLLLRWQQKFGEKLVICDEFDGVNWNSIPVDKLSNTKYGLGRALYVFGGVMLEKHEPLIKSDNKDQLKSKLVYSVRQSLNEQLSILDNYAPEKGSHPYHGALWCRSFESSINGDIENNQTAPL